MSRRLYLVPVNGDVYEVTMESNTILRIVRFIGDSQLRSDVKFDALGEKVREVILEEITKTE